MNHRIVITVYCLVLLALTGHTQELNRPIGLYPGNPGEYYGPTLVQDNEYRNLALFRPVYQSSCWDITSRHNC